MPDKIHYLDYDGLSEFKGSLNGVDIATTAGDGANYTATVPGITALKAGLTLTIIPHTVSTDVIPTLNVNGLGAKNIRRRLTNSTVSTTTGSIAGWLGANKPIRVTYDGTYWIADFDRPNAADLYGTMAVESGGTGATTAPAARANLGAQAQHNALSATLTASSWSNMKQTVSVAGVTENNTVIVTPDPETYNAYGEAGVYCTAQASGALTFACEEKPKVDLKVNVMILN